MKCLIVAAGRGTRLDGREQIKPLVPLRGVPLIRHVMDRAMAAGIDGFVVVSGCRGDEVRGALDRMAAADGIDITHVVNEAWQRANGVSVLAARGVIETPFVLAMCDHVVDPGIVAAVMGAPLVAGGVVLGVDRDLGNPCVDPEDVTRVRTVDGRIVAIGKMLGDYDCHDVGVFLCSAGMFSALEASQARVMTAYRGQ